jgi:hypothetical protein
MTIRREAAGCLAVAAETREWRSPEAVVRLCAQLFATHAPSEELLRPEVLLKEERPTGQPGVQNFTAGQGRHDKA